MAVSPIGTNETQTVATLRRRLESLYSQLAQEPLIVPDSRTAGSGFLKASDVQYLIFSVLYDPTVWRTLADCECITPTVSIRYCRELINLIVLVQVERGNGVNAYNALYSLFAQVIPRSYNEACF
jgi:hypothetical protein